MSLVAWSEFPTPVTPPDTTTEGSDPRLMLIIVVSIGGVIITASIMIIIVVAVFVRKAKRESSHVTSSCESRENTDYQELETTRRQANPDGTYAELQVQPVYEEISQCGS